LARLPRTEFIKQEFFARSAGLSARHENARAAPVRRLRGRGSSRRQNGRL
jgi:hypothetical protein